MRFLGVVVLLFACTQEAAPKLNADLKLETTAATSAQPAKHTAPAPASSADDTPPDAASLACVLSDRDWRDVVLWPKMGGLEAYFGGRDPSQRLLLRRRYENGAFHVAHGTPCEELETTPLGSRVRVLEGPAKGKTGWVLDEWRRGK